MLSAFSCDKMFYHAERGVEVMFSKFFKLKTVDPLNGLVTNATWKQRLQWLLKGCPLRNQKVVERFVQIKHRQPTINSDTLNHQASNTQVG